MDISRPIGPTGAPPLVVHPEQRPTALDVAGTQVTVLASNAATGGYEIKLQRGDEGTGPPSHSHDWDEAFYVLGGEIQFLCDGQEHICRPGTLVHVPRGTTHAFQYGRGGGQMLEIAGANARAARMFAAVDRANRPGPADVATLIEVLRQHGVTVAGQDSYPHSDE